VAPISICVKGMAFNDDISGLLLEWLLLVREQQYGYVHLYFYTDLPEKSVKVVR